jgi:hypothetical protein
MSTPPAVPTGPAQDSYAEAEERLWRLERLVAAQAAALRKVPRNMPVPRDVLALLSTAPEALRIAPVPPPQKPRLVRLINEIQAMIEDLTVRKSEVGGRIATVRTARRGGHSAHLVDYSG